MAGRNQHPDGLPRSKVTAYLPDVRIDWLQRQARRQDRSVSWLLDQAIIIATGEIERFPPVRVAPAGAR